MNELALLLQDFSWDTYQEVSDSLMTFDEGNIDDEITRYSSMYSYYNALLSKSKEILNDKEHDLHVLESTVRREAKSGSRVKLTAKDLDDLVETNEDVIEHNRLVRAAQSKYDLLRGLIRALEAKKDMLIQASSNRRAEKKLYDN